jgi:hypothetical protein
MQMEVVRHLQELVKTFNWHSPSWDLFIFAAWIAVSVIYSFAAGQCSCGIINANGSSKALTRISKNF